MFRKKSPCRDERGAAMMTAIIMSLFVFTTIMAIAGSSYMNLKVSAISRSSMKAFTAAEAGRDVALAGLTRGVCTPSATSTTDPRYTYTIYRYRSINGDFPKSLTNPRVVAGCPSIFSTHVLIHSVGRDSLGKKESILTTYRWHPTGSSPLSAAISSGANLPLSNTSVLLAPGSTTPGNVIVSSGSFRCLGSQTKVQGSVYVLTGDAELGGCSTINGNVSAGRGTDSSGNVIGGAVTFGGGTSRVVDGNVCAMDSVRGYRAGQVGGTVTQYQGSCQGLDSAVQWQDYVPPMSGAQVLNNGQCNNVEQRIANATTPLVIDALACGKLTINSASLQTDVTVVAKGFSLTNVTITSRDGLGYMFNTITPDYTTSTPSRAHCASDQVASTYNNVNMRPPMMGLIYTPCILTHMTGTWSGQVYSGGVQSNFAAGEIYYIPTPAPGVGLNGITGYTVTVPVWQGEY